MADQSASQHRPPVGAKFTVPAGDWLLRRRVVDALAASPGPRLVLLVAPAGSGKTTAVAQFARATSERVAWYRAERTESHESTFLGHLEHALGLLIPELPGRWQDVDTAARQLADVHLRRPSALVLDDLHELQHTPAEGALERLTGYLPAWLRIVAASRHEPAMNLPHLRVSGLVTDVPSDLLRWRHWEVERLFRDLYGQPLRPEDAALLTQRTEGWAAGLQLFHLATNELPAGDRRQLIHALHTRPGLVRSYLTRNVLARLPLPLRDFLVDTCVLGRLEPELCDALRGRDDSREFLTELAMRRLFTLPCEDGRGYRYHEVLRAYLELSLLRRDGAAATRERFARAAALLEDSHAVAEAIHAYARAEAWSDAERLLGTDGRALADGRYGTGLRRLPDRLLTTDPWLQLARARTLWRDGQLEAAVTSYRAAEHLFGHQPGGRICRLEGTALQPWINPQQPPPTTLSGLLRAATCSHPGEAALRAESEGDPGGLLVGALAAVLAGEWHAARRMAAAAGTHPDADLAVTTAARVLDLLPTAASDGLDRSAVHDVANTLESLGWTWVARMLRLLGSLGDVDDEERRALCVTGRLYGDRWGPPLVALLSGVASELQGLDGAPWLDEAASGFRELRAHTLEAWAVAWAAWSACRDEPGTDRDRSDDSVRSRRLQAEQARSLARRLGVPGAAVVADLAHAHLTGDRSAQRAAQANAESLGLPLGAPGTRSTPTVDRSHDPPPIQLRCFGGLQLGGDGTEADLTALKPQGRLLLGRLACPPGVLVPRDELIEVVWPHSGTAGAQQKLQVLVSTLRRLLEPGAPRGNWSLLQRVGEAYVLQLPATAHSDVATFDAALAQIHQARRDRDVRTEVAQLEVAFNAYRGALLPELGHGEWVTRERDRYRSRFAQVAQGLAEHHLANGEVGDCIAVAEAGLRADCYRSLLWGCLATAHRQQGDLAAAAHVEAQHAAVLEELGLTGAR